MVKRIYSFAVIVLLCMAIMGCKKDNNKDEQKNNFLKVDGTEYAISKGFLEYYGGDNSVYNIDLTLFSQGIIIQENMGIPDLFSGNGHTIYFEMYTSDSARLAPGTYADNNTAHAGSFDYAN